MLDQLREAGIPAVRDGSLRVASDFTAGRVVHALLRLLLYPEDGLPLGFLRDSEVSPTVSEFLGNEISSVQVRRKWESATPRSFLVGLSESLEAHGFLDPSEKRCLGVVHTLVADVCASEEGGVSALERSIAEARIDDTGAIGSVQVLTIHRSKGLEFDFVLLPDLDAGSPGAGKPGFWTRSGPHGIEAILEGVRSETCEAFPALREWAAEDRRDVAFEDLCVSYVAFTRAIHELHLFLGPRKGTSRSGIHYWLENALGIDDEARGMVFVDGVETRPRERKEAKERIAEEPPPVISETLTVSPGKLVAAGGGDERADGGRTLFAKGRKESLDLGREVHRILAGSEWPLERAESRAVHPAEKFVAEALRKPEVKELLKRPSGTIEIWRERAFDALIDGAWVSGVFDRVHLSTEGSPLIIDFKTDAAVEEEIPAAHRRQMEIYRKALALILGMEETRIEAKLVYLGPGLVYDVG